VRGGRGTRRTCDGNDRGRWKEAKEGDGGRGGEDEERDGREQGGAWQLGGTWSMWIQLRWAEKRGPSTLWP